MQERFQEGQEGPGGALKLKFMNVYEATSVRVWKEDRNQFQLCVPGKVGGASFYYCKLA